jgi:hypothetical protein
MKAGVELNTWCPEWDQGHPCTLPRHHFGRHEQRRASDGALLWAWDLRPDRYGRKRVSYREGR